MIFCDISQDLLWQNINLLCLTREELIQKQGRKQIKRFSSSYILKTMEKTFQVRIILQGVFGSPIKAPGKIWLGFVTSGQPVIAQSRRMIDINIAPMLNFRHNRLTAKHHFVPCLVCNTVNIVHCSCLKPNLQFLFNL